MKKAYFSILAVVVLLFSNCINGQSQKDITNLSADEFSERIKKYPETVVLDVRTPEEFSEGHLIKALNFDWNGDGFQNQVAKLDKEKPVFVYCRSGKRSADAAINMRSQGFKEVYELRGGILEWQAVNLPVTSEP